MKVTRKAKRMAKPIVMDEMKILIDISDPLKIPDELVHIQNAIINHMNKIDPEKKTLQGAMYRVIALRIGTVVAQMKRRMHELPAEYKQCLSQ